MADEKEAHEVLEALRVALLDVRSRSGSPATKVEHFTTFADRKRLIEHFAVEFDNKEDKHVRITMIVAPKRK